jgi:hypothetical protein
MIVAAWLQWSAFSLTAVATKVQLLWQIARRMRQRLLAVAYQTSRQRLRICENDPRRRPAAGLISNSFSDAVRASGTGARPLLNQSVERPYTNRTFE